MGTVEATSVLACPDDSVIESIVYAARQTPASAAKMLCNPQLSIQDAIRGFRAIYANSPFFDSVLLNWGREKDPSAVPRILSLLGAVSDGRRLTGALLPFLKSEHAYCRVLAAQLLARAAVNRDVVLGLMGDGDPRVRASVVEDVRKFLPDDPILERALADPHHRVVCNGVVRLAEFDPTRAVAILSRLATWSDWKFRSAAAWAISMCPHLPAMDLIDALRKDRHPRVRWNAMRAWRRFTSSSGPAEEDTESGHGAPGDADA